MPRDHVHSHRGKRSRHARERRAIDAALQQSPSVGVKPPQGEGLFHRNHHPEDHVFAEGVPVPDHDPRDRYFIAAPGAVYQEACEPYSKHGPRSDCPICGGTLIARREHIYAGRRPA
jgi:hypothetical protein